jgi:hypothetical protein
MFPSFRFFHRIPSGGEFGGSCLHSVERHFFDLRPHEAPGHFDLAYRVEAMIQKLSPCFRDRVVTELFQLRFKVFGLLAFFPEILFSHCFVGFWLGLCIRSHEFIERGFKSLPDY